MLTKNINRRDLISGSVGLGLGALAPRAAWAAETAGSVDDVKGDAHAEMAGAKRPLVRRSDVFVGDLIDTGASARLIMKLGARTTLKLGQLSKLKIEKYLADVGGDLELVDGVVQFERKGPALKSQLDFRSAYGLIAVRGTRFYAGMNRGRFAVLVGHGRVDVTAGGNTVQVLPDYGVDIAGPGAPPGNPTRWPVARVREMQANFR